MPRPMRVFEVFEVDGDLTDAGLQFRPKAVNWAELRIVMRPERDSAMLSIWRSSQCPLQSSQHPTVAERIETNCIEEIPSPRAKRRVVNKGTPLKSACSRTA